MAKNNKRQQKDFSLVHKLQGIGTQVTRNWYTSYKELVHKLQGTYYLLLPIKDIR
jgi:hypothetical protein